MCASEPKGEFRASARSAEAKPRPRFIEGHSAGRTDLAHEGPTRVINYLKHPKKRWPLDC